jgi:hypothetical protein
MLVTSALAKLLKSTHVSVASQSSLFADLMRKNLKFEQEASGW